MEMEVTHDHSIQFLTTYAFNNAGTVFGGQENKRLILGSSRTL